jgi:hypothetical protein
MRMRNWISGVVAAVGLVWMGASPAAALSLSADLDTGDCFSAEANKCVGGLYNLNVSQLDANTYQATLTMDYGGLYDLDVNRNLLMSIDFKVANTYLDPIVVTSAPGGTANWPALDGPLNANGCQGNDSAGFVCLNATTPVAMASSFTFGVQFDLAPGEALLAESDWHIGARFGAINPNTGRLNTSLLSASSAPIPEPTSYLLFGAGLIIVGGALRKQFIA